MNKPNEEVDVARASVNEDIDCVLGRVESAYQWRYTGRKNLYDRHGEYAGRIDDEWGQD